MIAKVARMTGIKTKKELQRILHYYFCEDKAKKKLPFGSL